MSKKNPGKLPLWPFAILLAGLVAAVLAYSLTPAPDPRTTGSGTALVGGPFELVDHEGNPYTDANLLGHYSVIYFGYTFCPDVCLDGMQTIAQAMSLLSPKELEQVQPIFVTVDPDRDTVEEMAQYVGRFPPKFTGLTGTHEQINKIKAAYRVYAEKGPVEDDSGFYLMDHSSVTYLMGPDGKYVDFFSHGIEPKRMADKIKSYLP